MLPANTFKILGIEHIGIAMKNNDNISSFFNLLPGLDNIKNEIIEDQMVKTDIYTTYDTKIELLNSTSPASTIEKYINKRGNSIHHIALRVDKIDNAINELMNKGIIFIDEKPRLGSGNCLIAFIHPKSTGGILFELCQRSE